MHLNPKQKVLAGVAVLLGGLLLGAAYALSSIDTHKIVRLVSAQVKAATGRELTIQGPVSVKVFPRLAVVAEQVALSNPAWAADPQLLSARQIAFSLQWMPLFSKRIEIDNVSVDQVQLVLQAAPPVNKVDGNWVLNSPTANAASSNSGSEFGFNLEALHLNQMSLLYKNPVGVVVESVLIKRFDINTAGNQVQLDGVMSWNGMPLTLKGQTDSWQTLSDNWSVKPTDFSLDLNVGLNKQSARTQGHIKFSPNKTPVLDLAVQSDGLDLQSFTKSQTAGSKTVAAPTNQGDRVLSAEPLDFNALPVWQGQVEATVSALTLPNGLKLRDVNATVTATGNDTLIFSPVTFHSGSGQISADGQINGVHSTMPTLKARGHATGLSFEHVMAQLGESGLVTGGPTPVSYTHLTLPTIYSV